MRMMYKGVSDSVREWARNYKHKIEGMLRDRLRNATDQTKAVQVKMQHDAEYHAKEKYHLMHMIRREEVALETLQMQMKLTMQALFLFSFLELELNLLTYLRVSQLTRFIVM